MHQCPVGGCISRFCGAPESSVSAHIGSHYGSGAGATIVCGACGDTIPCDGTSEQHNLTCAAMVQQQRAPSSLSPLSSSGHFGGQRSVFSATTSPPFSQPRAAPPPPRPPTDNEDADMFLVLPEALYKNYIVHKENIDGVENALVNKRLAACEELAQSSAKIVRSPML